MRSLKWLFAIGILIVMAFITDSTMAQESSQEDRLCVLWTSEDPHVAEKVCLMYTHGARKMHWFNEVVLVIWGPSQKTLSENPALQEKVREMQKDGVVVMACVNCANMYGLADWLKEFGIDVRPMGVPLTGMLKSGWKVLSF